MFTKIASFCTDEQGQGMTEYSLVLGVIAVGVVGVIFGIKAEVFNLYDKIVSRIRQAVMAVGLLD